MVPKLPRLAKTKTNKAGVYRFAQALPGKRYYVVALDVDEEGVFFAADITPTLKRGQALRFDVRETSPWEQRFGVK